MEYTWVMTKNEDVNPDWDSGEQFVSILSAPVEEFHKAVVLKDEEQICEIWGVANSLDDIVKYGRVNVPIADNITFIQVQYYTSASVIDENESDLSEYLGKIVVIDTGLPAFTRGIVLDYNYITEELLIVDLQGEEVVVHKDKVRYSNTDVISLTYLQENAFWRHLGVLRNLNLSNPQDGALLLSLPWLEKFRYEFTSNYPRIVEVRILGIAQ